MERTFLMIKPDAVQRNLIGEVISRIERKGLKLVGGKLMQVPMELAETHYGEHQGKPFYNDLISFITSAPVFAMVVEGEDAVNVS
ncbi:TPA: nucleoside-diphosphate kinase, partial [Staphylococcus aureus]|nr:nucleoside-diphosphate kinase [Staphylococcus aureus]